MFGIKSSAKVMLHIVGDFKELKATLTLCKCLMRPNVAEAAADPFLQSDVFFVSTVTSPLLQYGTT